MKLEELRSNSELDLIFLIQQLLLFNHRISSPLLFPSLVLRSLYYLKLNWTNLKCRGSSLILAKQSRFYSYLHHERVGMYLQSEQEFKRISLQLKASNLIASSNSALRITGRKWLESELGTKFSVLIPLPVSSSCLYYSSVQQFLTHSPAL